MLKKIKIPTFTDDRGDLSALEIKDFAQWEPKRVYYATNTKKDRGGHAVRGENKFYICLQGSCKGKFHDGKEWIEFDLVGPADAVLMEGLYWREFSDFAPNTVLVAVSSLNYDKSLYIMNFDDFVKEKTSL